MDEGVAAWMDRRANAVVQRQRSQADTAKLVATFSTGVAATMLATTLQVGDPTTLDRWTAASFALTGLLALSVVFADTTVEPDRDQLLARRELGDWDSERLLAELRLAELTSETVNDGLLVRIRALVRLQLVLALACCVLAVVGLLTSAAPPS